MTVPEILARSSAAWAVRVRRRWAGGDGFTKPKKQGATMTYQPKPGDIGLTTISGWGGRAIRLGQWANGDGWRSKQHAFVVVSDRDSIVEAMPEGARLVSNWHKASDTVYLRCPDEYRTAVAAAASSCVGRPYSWADYGALALHRFHIPAPHLKRYLRRSRSMICSQLADRAAKDGGWHLYSDGRWSGDVTPGDLYRLWEKQRDQDLHDQRMHE